MNRPMTDRRRLPAVFAACAVLLCTAGLPSARSQGLKPVATGSAAITSAAWRWTPVSFSQSHNIHASIGTSNSLTLLQ